MTAVADVQRPPAKSSPLKRRLDRGAAHSLWARAEPTVWFISAGLVICLAMIVGLLALVFYQGLTTFWPQPLERIETVSGETLMGEVTRRDRYELTFATAGMLPPEAAKKAEALLLPALHRQVRRSADAGHLEEDVLERWPQAIESLAQAVAESVETEETTEASEPPLLGQLRKELLGKRKRFVRKVAALLATCRTPEQLLQQWQSWQQAEREWLDLGDGELMNELLLEDPELLVTLGAQRVLQRWSHEVRVPVGRRLVRIGNYEYTNEHFRWVTDFEVTSSKPEHPKWALLLERRAWGRFYGTPIRFEIDGKSVADQPAAIWELFQRHHPAVQERWRRLRRLEKRVVGQINHEMEQSRLALRRIELRHGKGSTQWAQASRQYEARKAELEKQFAQVQARIERLRQENARYQLELKMADGRTAKVALGDIVRAYLPNQLTTWGRLAIYGARWWEFLSGEPREANSEGGIFPAIWGTVVMTLLMSVAVIPFGVLAALYLREYAKEGWVVSIVRISVNNLAGVPSIVFGVFGLGFFCYLVGASIDQLFFSERLPSPTFGTGGLLWASLTLALLTVPVVIVSTEEALAAVPRSMREGSLACGATKWQTIRRIVLPRALPGIMTGVILSMARGAGEVAPLMLVGAVKLAPELPVDTTFPFVHFQRSFMHLGFHIYDLGFQSPNSEAAKPMVYTTTLLLITLIAIMNVLAIALRSRLRRRFEGNRL